MERLSGPSSLQPSAVRGDDSIDVVLRVGGAAFDVDAFLGAHPELKPNAVWRRGERGPRREPHASSGFNWSVGSADDWRAAWNQARQRLEGAGPVLKGLVAAGATAELDVGLFMGGEEFVRSARFEVSDLALLLDLGLELRVSSYPFSDE